MEDPLSHQKNHSESQSDSLLGVNIYKPKRTISYKDKEVNVSIHGQPPLESPTVVKSVDDRSSGCLKCEIL
ncbi:hypothetical protein SteCoe_21747 [Stentor coeruleus]|uniref:Uncharacterized protein n=1 Tax=Stentor coeruleus TaxID=5963 RepID=A0A1R2BNU4_9CILI|nr:hypothetical protein SteCoe_21747 [Stentor coeruleus]